jgi:hypothetical protein
MGKRRNGQKSVRSRAHKGGQNIEIAAAAGKYLQASEIEELRSCEETILQGLNTICETFVAVGLALARIKQKRLYRQTHTTFEHYIEEKWQHGRTYGYRLIHAARVFTNLLPIGNIPMPTHESQLRPLVNLNSNDAKQAWTNAIMRANGGPVTAAIVRASASPFRTAKVLHQVSRRSRDVATYPLKSAIMQLQELIKKEVDYAVLLEKVTALEIDFQEFLKGERPRQTT